MKSIHERLLNNLGWYANWHNNTGYTPLHFFVLLMVALFAGSYLYSNIDVLAENDEILYATVIAQSDSLSTPHLLTGKSAIHEPGAFGKSAKLSDADTRRIENGTSKLQVKLSDEKTVVINLKSLEKRNKDNVAWRGSVQGKADSEVTLSLKNGYLAGSIWDGEDLYEIRPESGTKHVIEKMDTSLFPPEKESIAVAADASGVSGANSQTANTGATAGDVVEIDLLSVYTPQAREAAGGTAQIDAIIQSAVDQANTAFINSQVNAHYNLVATAEVVYNDSGNLSSDLNWVQSNSGVASLRNQYAADMVSLIVQNGAGYCGMGYVMRSPSSSFASTAFQVTARECAVGNLSFAHEHGHNMGMEHDPVNGVAASGASYQWSFGHYVDGIFRTVMSYASPCVNGCTRLPYFSNPNVSYVGYPTGIANQRDNARTANLTAPIVSGFKGLTPPATVPNAPSLLSATPVSSSRINLSWLDNSNNETGFKIERSLDGVNFSLVGIVGANVLNYANTGLLPNTTYYYQIKSYTEAGDSSPSNIGNTTTNAPDTTPPTVTITNNKVSGKSQYNITIGATDNVAVKNMQIVVGGVVKKTCNVKIPSATPSPCSVNIRLNTLTAGTAITALATDTSDNVGQTTGVIVK